MLISLGLQYSTEHNAGRIFVNLQGGPAQMPGHLISDSGAYSHHNPSQHQPQYPGGYQQHHAPHPQHGHQHQGNAGNADQEEIERVVKRYLPKVLRQLKRSCCTVM